MSSLLSAEISATCNALGYLDVKTNKYYADSNTLETVKDLIRYLRRDDENHTIRKQLGKTKVLQTDLLPLLKNYHTENDLFDVLLRLIMNLTTPPLLLYNFEIPKDKFVRNIYLEMEDHLQAYKEAFVEDTIWAVFSTQLSKILELDHVDRGEENGVKIERILVLIRNVLFVPSDTMEKRPDNDASIHDQVLWALHHSGLLDIILYITTNPMEQGYYMYTLEIMFFMLRNQQPNELATAALERSQSEKLRDDAELIHIRNLEQVKKQRNLKKYTGARHSRFGGTYVVQSIKSISDRDLISYKPINKFESLNFDNKKTKKKTPKNRLPLVHKSDERRSAFAIRLFLKEFCIEFLNGAYNQLMHYIKNILVRSGGDTHDESYYFWAMNFFMAFNRSFKFEIKLVSETLSVQTFHYVQQQSESYFELIKTDRKKLAIWSQRLHTALLCYKELFLTLLAMEKCEESVKESSKVIKSNIFYVPEYREFILTLLVTYDEIKMSDVYLKDLMETQHLFLSMFEHFCNKGSIKVQKKAKRKYNKKSQPSAKKGLEDHLNKLWDKEGPQLSAVLESGGNFLIDEVPFDAASDVPIDEQKSNAMKKIQGKLRNSEFETAISLMRAAREVWPENDYFGNDNMSTEEEFLALREIFFTNFGGDDDLIQNNEPAVEDNDDEDEENEVTESREVDFSFTEFLRRLCHPKVVRACGIALRSFEKNSVNTNHSIIKLMHRIAFDCKMYAMMFQVSLFKTFQQIFTFKDLPQFKELVKFSIYIIRNFLEVAGQNEKVYIEALFWKTKRDAFDIENGYGSYEVSTRTKENAWSEAEELELTRLFEEHSKENIDEDVIDWIIKNLVNSKRNRRMVLKKLREMDLIDSYKHKYKSNVAQRNQSWSSEEEMQLTELYNEYKDSSDPIGLIMANLEIKRPKNRIIEKMLTLGLIEDKTQLRKKRQKKSGNPQNKKSSTGKVFKFNKNEIVRLCVQNINSGRRAGLEWLHDSFTDAMEEFEDDGESIPLITLSSEVDDCLENLEFQALLKAFGLSPPSNEQEHFWRIPENIGLSSLERNDDLLTSVLKHQNPERLLKELLSDSDDEPARIKPKKRVFRNLKKRADKSRQFTRNSDENMKKEVTYWVTKNLKAGRREGLEWLKGNFEDALEDYEESGEGIPLVTLSADIEDFMSNWEFQALLKAFYLTEPFDEQETFWRIPGNLELDTLKYSHELLTSLLDNNGNQNNESEPTRINVDSDPDESIPRNLRKSKKSVDKNEITKLLRQNLNAGKLNALEWLKDCFVNIIEDFEDYNEAIPLLPLSEDIGNCLENLEFQTLLKELGLSEPVETQENHWKIPMDMELDTLRQLHQLLTSWLNDNSIENGAMEVKLSGVNENTSDQDQNKNANENDEEIEDRIDSSSKRSRILSSSSSEASSPSRREVNTSGQDQNKNAIENDEEIEDRINSSSKRSRMLSSSSSEASSPPRKEKNTSGQDQNKNDEEIEDRINSSKRSRVLSSSSSEASSPSRREVNTSGQDQNKNAIENDEEIEDRINSSSKRSRMLSSSSSEASSPPRKEKNTSGQDQNKNDEEIEDRINSSKRSRVLSSSSSEASIPPHKRNKIEDSD